MGNYLLIEERMLQPYRPKGFLPNPKRMGFLDFLRELGQEVFPFSRGNRLCVVGLEEVLLQAGSGENLMKVSLEIRKILTARANELEANLGQVQIVFRRPLKRSDDFWFDPGGNRRMSLRPIFGSPIKQTDQNGNEYYMTGFNLT
ncbi:MAG: hypothetical protein H6Q43_205 [Deltaproteobacteria bacterium]|nr:hypothetical protein [Deltaproteobacteria bacterium]